MINKDYLHLLKNQIKQTRMIMNLLNKQYVKIALCTAILFATHKIMTNQSIDETLNSSQLRKTKATKIN